MQFCLLSLSEIHHLCNFVLMGNHYNCLSIFFCFHLKQGDYLFNGLGIKISCRLICKYNFRTIHLPLITTSPDAGIVEGATSRAFALARVSAFLASFSRSR